MNLIQTCSFIYVILSLLEEVNSGMTISGEINGPANMTEYVVPSQLEVVIQEADNIPQAGETVEEKQPKDIPSPKEVMVGADDDEHPHYEREVLAGSKADLFASNRHYKYSNKYEDLSRKSDHDDNIIPTEAPLELVLLAAEKAASMPLVINPDEFVVDKKALRSGNYWDSYYKEDGIKDMINPSSSLRSDSSVNKQNINENIEDEDLSDRLTPVQAPEEMVLQAADEAEKLAKEKLLTVNPNEFVVDKKALRSGQYWNGYWSEDINKNFLRSRVVDFPETAKVQKVDPNQEAFKARIRFGTKLYNLANILVKRSPTLLYVINDNNK